MPVLALLVALGLWITSRNRDQNRQAAPPAPPAAAGETSPGASAPSLSQAERLAATRPSLAAAAPEEEAEPQPVITPELRQERTSLHETLAAQGDATLDAVRRAFEPHGVTQPDVLASGWILAQHWAIAARAEQQVAEKVEDPAQREELARVRRRILIQTAEAEMAALLGSTPDSRVLADLETLGRSLRDQPPVPAELLPNRAAARAVRQERRDRPALPPEE